MSQTKIEWADAVWNPVTGCTPVSEGCANCYARRFAQRMRGRFGYPKDDPFRVKLHRRRLEEPLRWRKPMRIFVCSMGDLFHPDVPADFICHVYHVMKEAKQHTFIVLTKRPERIVPVLYWEKGGFYLGGGDYIPNVWHLTSVENQEAANRRIPALLELRKASNGWPVLGVSVEPMLGPVDLLGPTLCAYPYKSRCNPAGCEDWGMCRGEELKQSWLYHLNWVIVGGETGPNARPIHPDWVRSLRDHCQAAGVPFFFKQWGEWQFTKLTEPLDVRNKETGDFETWPAGKEVFRRVGRKVAGRLLDGRVWDEYPEVGQ